MALGPAAELLLEDPEGFLVLLLLLVGVEGSAGLVAVIAVSLAAAAYDTFEVYVTQLLDAGTLGW